MNDYILFMHGDGHALDGRSDTAWPAYFATLRQANAFEGGSAIGGGVVMSKAVATTESGISPISGYIRLRAESLEAACALVAGNPVYEAGGMIEVRELPRSD